MMDAGKKITGNGICLIRFILRKFNGLEDLSFPFRVPKLNVEILFRKKVVLEEEF